MIDHMGGRVSSPRFVGRTAELASLGDLLDEAGTGRPRVALVVGDSGIGKSRLLAEVIAQAAARTDGSQERGPQVLSGHCLGIPGGGLPYAPLTEALRRLAREIDPATLEGLLGPARGELARLLPELAGGQPMPLPGAAGRADQARLFELVLGLLGRLGSAAPTVLIVEDLHWVDDATRPLLTFLARNLTTERLLVVATCRADAYDPSGDLAGWLAELERSPSVRRIELGPLSPTEIDAQLAGILGSSPPRRLATSIAVRSGGNALFAEELLAAAETAPDDSGDGAGPGLPATLADLMAVRVRGLEGPARQAARMLAIAGRPVDDRLLAAATDLDDAVLDLGLRDAIDRHVVVADSTDGTIALRHVLLGEAIVGGLLAGERRRLHERFARALVAHPELADRSPAGAAGELARHWAAAGRDAEAFAAAVEAARSAMAVHAHVEAYRQFRLAIERWDRLAPGERSAAPELVPLLLEAEEPADLSGDLVGAEALVRRALAMTDPGHDPRMAGVLHARLAYLAWLSGRSHEELEAYRTAVQLVPEDPPTLERARVLGGRGAAGVGGGG
jgi:hypothetical protein